MGRSKLPSRIERVLWAGHSNRLRLRNKSSIRVYLRSGPVNLPHQPSTMSESSMSKPRRNPSRSARPTDCTDELWYPNIRDPGSDVDRQIQTLNREAYSGDVFGRVDDLLMFTLFATKQAKQPRKRRHHAVIPERASDQPMKLTIEEGAEAANICSGLLGGKEASMDEVQRAVSELQRKIQAFQSPEEEWAPCLRQCVEFLVEFECVWEFGFEPMNQFALQVLAYIFCGKRSRHLQGGISKRRSVIRPEGSAGHTSRLLHQGDMQLDVERCGA